MPEASSILRRLLRERIKRGQGATAPPKIVEELGEGQNVPFEELGWFGKSIDILSRPMYASAGFARGLVKGRNPFTGAWKGFTGAKRTTFSDVLGDLGVKKGLSREVAGFAGDVLLDPTTYLTFGVGAAGKMTARGAQLQSRLFQRSARNVQERLAKELGGRALGEVEESVAKAAFQKVARGLEVPELFAEKMATPGMLAGHLAKKRMEGVIRGVSPARRAEIVRPRAVRFAGAPVGPVSAQQTVGRGIKHLGRLAAEMPGMRQAITGTEKMRSAARAMFVTTPPGPYGKQIKEISDFARETANIDKQAVVDRVRKMAGEMSRGLLKGKTGEEKESAFREIIRLLEPIEKNIYDLPAAELQAKIAEDLVGLRGQLAEIEAKTPAARAPVEAQVAEKFAPGVAPVSPRESLLREKVELKAREKSIGRRYKKQTAELKKAEAAVGKPPAKVKERIAARLAKEPKGKAERAARREAMKGPEVAGARASIAESKRVLGDIRGQGGVFWAKVNPSTGKWTDMDEIMELPKHLRASASRIQSVRVGRVQGKSGIGIDELADEWGVSSSEAVKIIQEHHKVSTGALEGAVKEGLPMARKLAGEKAKARILKKLVHEEAVKRRPAVRRASGLRKETEREGAEVRSRILEVDKRLAAAKPVPAKQASGRRLAIINSIQARISKGEHALRNLPKAREILGEDFNRSIRKAATIDDEKIEGTFEWAQKMKGEFERIHKLEQDLPIPTKWREGYFPHVMKPEYRKALHKAFMENPQRMLKHPKNAALGHNLSRTFEGTVDEFTFDELQRHGFIDMKAAKEELIKQGKKLDPNEVVFETNPLEVYFKRASRSINARTNVKMQEAMIQELSEFRAGLDDWDGLKSALAENPGHAVFIPAKDYVKLLTPEQLKAAYGGEISNVIRSGIEEIKPGRKDLKSFIKRAQRLKKETGKTINAFLVPREAAEHLAALYKVIETDDAIREAAHVWDRVTGYWKTWATVPRPAFHVRNAFSNLWQNYLGGMGISASKFYGMAAQMQIKGKSLKGLKGVGPYSMEEVAALSELFGITRKGFVGGDILQDVRHRLLPTTWNPLSEGGFVIRTMATLPQGYENNARIAHFMFMLDKTGDPVQAAISVKKHLFDYQDLTHFEKTVMRRVAPFYSWTRKNIPLQAEKFITDPGKFLTLKKTADAVERLSAGDEQVLDRKHVASWIKDANGIRVKVDKDGKHHFWLMSGWIPAADLSKFDAGEMLNMMHPLPKLVLEKSINQDFFSGRKISRFPGEKVEFVGVTMSPGVRHVLKQMVILNEIDRVSRDKGTPGQVIARTIVRTYPQDPTRALTRYVIESRAEISRYKKDYKKAVAKHGEDAMIPRALKSQIDRLEREFEDAKKEGKRRDPQFMRWRRKQSAAPTTMQALKARASARVYSRFKEAAGGK